MKRNLLLVFFIFLNVSIMAQDLSKDFIVKHKIHTIKTLVGLDMNSFNLITTNIDIYDSVGIKTENVSHDLSEVDSNYFSLEKYTYDNNGNLIEEKYFDKDSKQTFGSTIYKYNEENDLIEREYLNENGDSTIYETEIIKDKEGNKSFIQKYKGDYSSFMKKFLDENGNEIHRVTILNLNKLPSGKFDTSVIWNSLKYFQDSCNYQFMDIYKCNSEGQMIEWNKKMNGQLIFKSFYNYSNGKKKNETYYNVQNGIETNYSRTEFEYDSDLLMKENYFNVENGKKTLSQIVKYEYEFYK